MTPEHAAMLATLIYHGWSYRLDATADTTISPFAPERATFVCTSPAKSTTITGSGRTMDEAIDSAIANASACATVFFRIDERRSEVG